MAAMAVMIDPLEFADASEKGGFAPQQARTLATAPADAQSVAIEDLSTKTDVGNAVRNPSRDIVDFGRKFSADLREQIAKSELASERHSKRHILAVLVLVPILSKAVDLVSKHYGL